MMEGYISDGKLIMCAEKIDHKKIQDLYSEYLEVVIRELYLPVYGKCGNELTRVEWLGIYNMVRRFEEWFGLGRKR